MVNKYPVKCKWKTRTWVIFLIFLFLPHCQTLPSPNLPVPAPETGRVDMDFAIRQFSAKRYDVAEFYLKKTLVVFPEHLKALNLLGWSYFFQNRFDKALVAFQRLHALDSKSPDPVLGMAWSYFTLNYFEQALETFDKARDLSADPFQVHKGKGFTYLKLLQKEKARREFSRIYNSAETERLMVFWEKWQAWKPGTLIRTLPTYDHIYSVFAWPADKPRYKNLISGLEPEEHRRQVDAAWDLFMGNAYGNAIDAFNHLPAPQGDSLDSRNGLAWSHLGNGDIRTAETIFRNILRTYPDFLGAVEGLEKIEELKREKTRYALYYLNLKKHLIAFNKFEEIAGDFPDWSFPHSQMGFIHLHYNNYQEAKNNFQIALQLNPDDNLAQRGMDTMQKILAAPLYKANQALAQNNYKAAERLYRSYIDEQGSDPANTEELAEAYNGLGWSLYGKGRIAWAIPKFEKARSHANFQASALKGLGLSYYRIGTFDKAAEFLKSALESFPDDQDLVYKLDWSILRMKDLIKAESHFLNVVKQHPLRASAYMGLGWIYYRSHKPDLAVEYFMKAISLDPDFALTENFRKLLEGERYSWQVYNHLGWAHYERRSYQKSLELFRISLDLAPDKSETLKGMGYNLFKLGKYREALFYFTQCLKSNPNPRSVKETLTGADTVSPFQKRTSVRTKMGRVHLHLGEYKKAVQRFNEELALHPNWTEVHDGLGWTYMKMGRYAESRAAFDHAIRYQPMNNSAHRGLYRLKQLRANENVAVKNSPETGLKTPAVKN